MILAPSLEQLTATIYAHNNCWCFWMQNDRPALVQEALIKCRSIYSLFTSDELATAIGQAESQWLDKLESDTPF